MNSVGNTTPFAMQDTNGVPITVTNQLGTSASAFGVTAGDLFVNLETVLVSPATFAVGDTLTITEDGGPGVATAVVASIHEGKKIGAIATQVAFNTDNPFTASDTSGVAVTFGYNDGVTTQRGSGLAGTATVSGPTLLDSVQLTSFGQGFMVGDIIDVDEDGGVGKGHITVQSIQ
tara:strand:- start:603 stop:1127 length:525 start_codon:yes stop_codon:yes gene_type:complete